MPESNPTATATPTLAAVPATTRTRTAAAAIGTPTPTPVLSRVPPQPGWTLLALPDYKVESYTAASLLDDLTAQGIQATQIARWQDGSWQSYVLGFPINGDMPIESGRGYFVKSGNGGTWTPRPAVVVSAMQR